MIHLNFAGLDATTCERLEAGLKDSVTDIAAEYGIELKDNYASLMFKNLILQMARKSGKQVVLLLDEYDKPLTDNIDCIAFRY